MNGLSPPALTYGSAATSRPAVVDMVTVDQLATARCDRAMACNEVGGGLKYATSGVCLNDMRGPIANDLNSYTCPGGFDHAQVGRCMDAIKRDRCDHPLETLVRMDECLSGALCAK